MNIDDLSLGEQLLIRRKRMGMSQLDVSRAAKCSRSLVSMIENGQFDVGAIGRIAEVLGLNLRITLEETQKDQD